MSASSTQFTFCDITAVRNAFRRKFPDALKHCVCPVSSTGALPAAAAVWTVPSGNMNPPDVDSIASSVLTGIGGQFRPEQAAELRE